LYMVLTMLISITCLPEHVVRELMQAFHWRWLALLRRGGRVEITACHQIHSHVVYHCKHFVTWLIFSLCA
jgi:hypothetical protein